MCTDSAVNYTICDRGNHTRWSTWVVVTVAALGGCVLWRLFRRHVHRVVLGFVTLEHAKAGATQLVVFASLTFIHAIALLLYRFSEEDGEYQYSIASVVFVTEGCKLCLAIVMYDREQGFENLSKIRHMPAKVVAQTISLSAVYTLNNLLSFTLVHMSTPATVAVAKSTVPYVCAAVSFALRFDQPSSVQWYAIFFQSIGVLLTQMKIDGATSGYSHQANVYLLLLMSVGLTAFSSVFNNKVIKVSGESMHAINIVMYASGMLFSAIPLLTYDRPQSTFFGGYNTAVVFLILVMSVYGIAIAYAYKVSNVFVKNLSSSASLCVVWAVGLLDGDQEWNLPNTLGILLVVASTMLYFKHDHVHGNTATHFVSTKDTGMTLAPCDGASRSPSFVNAEHYGDEKQGNNGIER